MTSIITGDIINSRKLKNPTTWLTPLKEVFQEYGKTPKVWEVFRGDSFQIEIKKPETALLCALKIKACIKSIKELDVRMAIGIGPKDHAASKITESNGEAFIYSGETFENLKKWKKNLAIKSPWAELDSELNLMLTLASIGMDRWTPIAAELMFMTLKHRHLSQKELAEKIGRPQSSISEGQKRAHYNEIMELEAYYHNKIGQQPY
ncbi:transcriptional regulator [Flavisolibacter tropicus]|uniref:Regulatory protein MarR n=1 Tax=Flavisolibacter tropicus TaxID=1492898 RepID=A0A172TRS5_9BACT|nr:transcriptional regulator [Flavisolibacter tropicus]ANE49497.1 regulatory protein MarR [Flavisolibacter tropicus]